MPFQFKKTRLPDIVLIEPKIFIDERGFFSELYKESEFKANGINGAFLQVNRSMSKKNVLRGLHYQMDPKAQDKLVFVLKGEIFDVVVDIRKGSPSFGHWVAERLSAENRHMLFIPAGFAHGYCVLSDEAEFVYYCSREYAPELERNIIWNDPVINIDWPIKDPVLSPRDLNGKLLELADNNFFYKNCHSRESGNPS